MLDHVELDVAVLPRATLAPLLLYTFSTAQAVGSHMWIHTVSPKSCTVACVQRPSSTLQQHDNAPLAKQCDASLARVSLPGSVTFTLAP